MDLCEQGRHAEAYAMFVRGRGMVDQQLLQGGVPPWHPVHLSTFGIAAYRSGHAEDALKILEAACQHDADSCVELSLILKEVGRHKDAQAVLEAVISQHPLRAKLWLALGLVHTHGGDYQDGMRVFQAGARAFPEDTKLRVNYAQALGMSKGETASLPALLAAHAREPKNIRVILLLVKTYINLDRPQPIARFLNLALSLDPDHPEALESYAKVLRRVKEYEKALGVLRRLAQKKGGIQAVCKLVQFAQSIAAWGDYEALIPQMMAELRKDPSPLMDCLQPLEATVNPLYSEEDLQYVTRRWADHVIYDIIGAKWLKDKVGAFEGPVLKGGDQFRLGYLSSNLQGGAVWLMIRGIWEAHARLQGRGAGGGCSRGACARHTQKGVLSDVYTYSSVKLDSNNKMRASYDELHALTAVRDLPYPSDKAGAARVIRSDALHALVNINGWCDSGANDLFTVRLAPLQISYMGYPGSMGSSDWTDFLITDSTASPADFQAHYTEKLIYLPYTYYINDFRRLMPELGTAAPDLSERETWGLPADKFVYVCFSRAEKIDRQLFLAWMSVLKRAPDSVLWLLRDVGRGDKQVDGSSYSTSVFKQAAVQEGVDPARMIFSDSIDWADHVKRGGLADVFLDTLAYNAHSTGCNSLWAGVPIVTMPGVKMASRVAAGMNRGLGVPVYTSRTLEDYVDLSVRLYERRGLSRELARDMQAKRASAPLFDTEGMTEAIDRSIRMAWDVWAEGQRYMHVLPSDLFSL